MSGSAPIPASRPGDVRVGDRERSEAAERLSAHAAAGRLDVEELEARLERAQAAVLVRDLQALEADLPGAAARAPRLGSPLAGPARRAPWPGPRLPAGAVAALVALCVAAAVLATLATGHPVAGPLVAALLLWRFAARPARVPRRSLR